MHTAAKVLGGVLIDLYEKPEALKKVRDEFEAALGGRKYQTIMPTDRKFG